MQSTQIILFDSGCRADSSDSDWLKTITAIAVGREFMIEYVELMIGR